jgi:hypothetical protein
MDMDFSPLIDIDMDLPFIERRDRYGDITLHDELLTKSAVSGP